MEADIPRIPLFHSLPQYNDIPQSLFDKPVEAECYFYRQSSRNAQMQDEGEFQPILLQIVDQYVVQRTNDRQHVLSYFSCDYQIQFEIVRKQSQVPNRLGDALKIKFIFKKDNNKEVQLQVRPQNRKQLEIFGKILGRKYIIQLGFHNSFKAIKKIGKGMTACVYNAVNFANGREVAIKSFKRSVYFEQDNGNGRLSFLNQFKILTIVNHKNLCQLMSVYETDNSTYVILELYPLSLYGYLQKFGFPSIEQVKCIMINLLEGIAFLHSKGIMHRDLKLENIMVKKQQNRTGRVIPVIVDFGLAQYTSSTKYMYTRCGTPGYVAPQVLKIKSSDPVQTYTSACDIFSLGVIFYILLFKKPLFEGSDVKDVIKKNSECSLNFQGMPFTEVPSGCRDLLKLMLTKDVNERITASNALNHPFLSDDVKRLQAQAIEAQNIYQTEYTIHM